ncbi:MAG: hypothetical protein LBH06_01255 [Rikenellaceae bacterium]|jgi:hypothetical protein|nr:hypothetical protein [Rikenellaceae bacterium]
MNKAGKISSAVTSLILSALYVFIGITFACSWSFATATDWAIYIGLMIALFLWLAYCKWLSGRWLKGV